MDCPESNLMTINTITTTSTSNGRSKIVNRLMGRDFPIDPVEVPSLRSQMEGKLNMIIGLANDEIGYILPKSQWDTEPPYAYGREKAQYGEFNSFGPEVGPVLHQASLEALRDLHAALGS